MCFYPPVLLTWQWKMPIFNREYIFNRSIFPPPMLVYQRVDSLPCQLCANFSLLRCFGVEMSRAWASIKFTSHSVRCFSLPKSNQAKELLQHKNGWPWKIHPLLSFRLMDATQNNQNTKFSWVFFRAVCIIFGRTTGGGNSAEQKTAIKFTGETFRVQRRSSEMFGTN